MLFLPEGTGPGREPLTRLEAFPSLRSSGARKLRVVCSCFSRTNGKRGDTSTHSWLSEFTWPTWDSRVTPLPQSSASRYGGAALQATRSTSVAWVVSSFSNPLGPEPATSHGSDGSKPSSHFWGPEPTNLTEEDKIIEFFNKFFFFFPQTTSVDLHHTGTTVERKVPSRHPKKCPG